MAWQTSWSFISKLAIENSDIIRCKSREVYTMRGGSQFKATVDFVNMNIAFNQTSLTDEEESQELISAEVIVFLQDLVILHDNCRDHKYGFENGFRLDDRTCESIYEAVSDKWTQISGGQQFKVIAAFVVTSRRKRSTPRVLSIGTGSKCVFRDSMLKECLGTVVHDSHAEI